MPPTNKNLTYEFAGKVIRRLICSHVRFLRSGLFLTFNPGWTLTFSLSWSFHGRFSTKSPHISPRIDHKWNTNTTSFPGSLFFPPPTPGGGKKRDPGNEVHTNSSWTHYVIWASHVKLTGGLKCWHVKTPLMINVLVTQNTTFAITLLEKLVLKYFFKKRKPEKWAILW